MGSILLNLFREKVFKNGSSCFGLSLSKTLEIVHTDSPVVSFFCFAAFLMDIYLLHPGVLALIEKIKTQVRND